MPQSSPPPNNRRKTTKDREMTYDFTSIMDRHGKDSIAVDALGKMPGMAPEPPKEGLDAIPMWVADMNFPTVPSIPEAIIERAKHPAYGYFSPTDEYFDSIIRWQTIRNDVVGLTRESIGYENGVLGGAVSAITAFAAPGDAVLLHSPTYIGFTSCIENMATISYTVRSNWMSRASGAWISKIWTARSKRTTSMWRCSAVLTIRAGECGNVGNPTRIRDNRYIMPIIGRHLE